MTIEIENDPQTTQEDLSAEEKELYELGEKIWTVHEFMWKTFFKDETWYFRQACAYGFDLLGIPISPRRLRKEDSRIKRKILQTLKGRIDYFEAAYHFIDKLSALGHNASPSFVSMATEKGADKNTEALDRLVYVKGQLNILSYEIEGFSRSKTFRRAFKIAINTKTGEFAITDLKLDPQEIISFWDSHIPSIYGLRSQLANDDRNTKT